MAGQNVFSSVASTISYLTSLSGGLAIVVVVVFSFRYLVFVNHTRQKNVT